MEKELDSLGVQEPASENSTRATPLGKEVDLDLISVFLGIHCEWEAPYILEQYGLIDAIDADRLLNRLPAKEVKTPSGVIRLLPDAQIPQTSALLLAEAGVGGVKESRAKTGTGRTRRMATV
jgi:hypothetical protein